MANTALQTQKTKRTLKDKMYFVVFGKYPEIVAPNEEDNEDKILEDQSLDQDKGSQIDPEEIQEEGDRKIENTSSKVTSESKKQENSTQPKSSKKHSGKDQLINAGKKMTAGLKNFSVNPEDLSDEGLPLEDDVEDDERVFAGISYVPFLCFFTLSSRKDSPFVMYHSWQSFALLVIILASLPIYLLLGWIFIFKVILWIIYFLIFGISFFSAFLAWSGRYVQIPFISGFAKQLSGR